jgi:hypothetical protein
MKTLSTHRWAMYVFALLATTSHAQTYQWHKQFAGNQPNISQIGDMVVDANGNVFVTGSFSAGLG